MRRATNLLAIIIVAAALHPQQLFAQLGEQTQEVVLTERVVTNYQPVQKRVVVPTRSYHAESRVQGWWNPFREPRYIVTYMPTLSWEERLQTSYVPITHKQYVAETRVAQSAPQPLVLAQRPAKPVTLPTRVATQTIARPQPQMQDSLPIVPVVATRPATTYRQAQIHEPQSTLVPSNSAPRTVPR